MAGLGPKALSPQPLELQNLTLLPVESWLHVFLVCACPPLLMLGACAGATQQSHCRWAPEFPKSPSSRQVAPEPNLHRCFRCWIFFEAVFGGLVRRAVLDGCEGCKCVCAVVEIVCPAVSCGQAQRWEEVALEEAERPAPRGAHSAVCDPKSHSIVVFGGAALSFAWNPAMCRCSRTYTYLYNFKSQNWQGPG
ncbi:unnamed protein product [Symbiodinium natans]|uniref:Uncharacterized protein n=1 Tax=Symbiodinium natans TaxID=878477 RepID=A0A812G8P7_9DINO|nr:unnamed protein product [Symbiodinium natans]